MGHPINLSNYLTPDRIAHQLLRNSPTNTLETLPGAIAAVGEIFQFLYCFILFRDQRVSSNVYCYDWESSQCQTIEPPLLDWHCAIQVGAVQQRGDLLTELDEVYTDAVSIREIQDETLPDIRWHANYQLLLLPLEYSLKRVGYWGCHHPDGITLLDPLCQSQFIMLSDVCVYALECVVHETLDRRMEKLTTHIISKIQHTMSQHNRIKADRLDSILRMRTMQLEQAKERVETILNNSTDAILLADCDGRIEQTNPQFNEMFRCPPDHYFNQPLINLIHPGDQSKVQTTLERLNQIGGMARLEAKAQVDGSIFDLELGLSILRQNGKLDGIICNLHDISERKQIEAELRNNLERERELQTMRSQFISMASHQFRTPLAIILSTIESINTYFDKMDEAQRQQRFEKIYRQIHHVTELMDDVLNISRMEGNPQDVDLQPIPMCKLITEIIEDFRLTLKKHQLVYHYPDVPSTYLYSNEKLLRQIINNVLSNAAKYSPNGGIIEVSLVCEYEQLHIMIRDEGIGIPDEAISQVFDGFFRAENVEDIPGTGLGLKIVKEGMLVHGGSVDIQSKLDEGTTIILTFPRLAN